jgi:hypothetical protein
MNAAQARARRRLKFRVDLRRKKQPHAHTQAQTWHTQTHTHSNERRPRQTSLPAAATTTTAVAAPTDTATQCPTPATLLQRLPPTNICSTHPNVQPLNKTDTLTTVSAGSPSHLPCGVEHKQSPNKMNLTSHTTKGGDGRKRPRIGADCTPVQSA